VNGASYTFSQLQLSLQDNQRVSVHALLYGRDNKDVVFTGRLNDHGRRDGRLSADIDNVAYGRDTDSADASCDIDMGSGKKFNSVTINGRNSNDRNKISLDFVSNGREVTDYQGRWPNRDRDNNRDHNNDGDRGRNASGRYSDTDEWRRRNDHFKVTYALDLRQSGDVRLVVAAEDRNMPDDRDARYDHGDILKYLQDGHDVIETGRWTQNGDRVTITFDSIQYGRTSCDKREVLKGRVKGNTLWIDDFEKSFYGHGSSLSFEKKGWPN